MTKYIKTGTTEFEQFDGSDEMCKKYRIRKDSEYLISDDPLEYQIVTYQMESLEGWLNLNVGDWIATGVEGEHWPVKDEIFQKTYKKLPVIPKLIAEYIADMKSQGDDIWDATHHFIRDDNLAEYMEDNSEVFARAWLDGYEVAEVEE